MVLYSKFAYGFQFSGGETSILKMIHGCQDIKQKPCLILFGTPCRGSIMIYMSWRISLDISLSTYHFWYVTLAISLLTYHSWHVNLYFSILICYSCLVCGIFFLSKVLRNKNEKKLSNLWEGAQSYIWKHSELVSLCSK